MKRFEYATASEPPRHWLTLRRMLALVFLTDALLVALWGRRYLAWRRAAPRWYPAPLSGWFLRLPTPFERIGALLPALSGLWLWRAYSSNEQMVTVSTHFPAPREQVFAAIADPQKPFLTRNPITRMEVVGVQRSGAGTVYRWTFTLPLGLRFTFDEAVTEWVEPERFAYRALSGWQMEAINALTPENGGTRLTFTLRYRFPSPWKWLVPQWLVRLGIKRSLVNIERTVTAQHHEAEYIPALRFNFLTPLYDPIMRRWMREEMIKRRLIREAQLEPGFRVLDLGCGTGTLTILVKQMHPTTQVVGIDGDDNVLAIARAKAEQQRVEITFDQGLAFQLPYADASFDRVLSSLVLHHLTTDDRQRALGQVWRILKPGGEFLIIDFGPPRNGLAWVIALAMRHLERAADLINGLLPDQLRRAGFQNVQIVTRFMTGFGSIALYRARKS